MSLKKEWNYKEYISFDENIERPTYENEIEFYESVKNGNVESLRKEIESLPFKTNEGWGILSKDEHRNQIYHFVITTAIIARMCIEGGLEVDEAYSISDYYIQKADTTTREKEIVLLHHDMIIDYATRMRETRKTKIYSKPISKCIDYIYNHLNENLEVRDIAEKIKLSRSYLSTLFKKETSMSINEYINIKKIQTAQNMLKYSDYTISEISNILSFSSQSYFTRLFKQYCGETPRKYANKKIKVLSK